MYFIQSLMNRSITSLPETLPAGLYQQAGGRAQPMSPSSSYVAPLSRNVTGDAHQRSSSVPARFASPTPSSPSGGRSAANIPWDVTVEEKANTDSYFDGLDTSRVGYLEGDVAVPFLLNSQLPDAILAHVWFVLL